MTTSKPRRHSLPISLLTMLVALLLAGCGGSSRQTSSSGDSDTASTASGGAASTTSGGAAKSDREKAEDYLHKLIDEYDTVLADYRAGKTDQAYDAAHELGEGYEGNTEQHVAKASATVQRQLDPLIEATLPGAIKRNASQQEVASLIQRAQGLCTQALEAIEKAE